MKKRTVVDKTSSRGACGTLTGLDTETLPPLKRVTDTGDPVVVGLTILCHPDPERVGEQAHLQPLALGNSVMLSRVDTEFRQPGGSRSRPLADPYVSRRPLVLEWRSSSFIIRGEVQRHGLVIDGEGAVGEVPLEEERLETGVVLELAGRVALLLHLLTMPRQAGSDFGIVGASEPIIKVRAEIDRVAKTEVPVLLRGESGTGKELVAQAIHAQSGRCSGPFVSVNMAAIPPSTAASGLFGHVKGAFTGATTSSTGFFGQAHGGTLFLDEIGDTPMEIQVLLLRALESGEVQPVGAQTVRHVDVRVIAATETDLEQAVEAGRFRQAFLHRIAGYELRVPPLRARRDDVARLLIHFLRQELAKIGLSSKLAKPVDRSLPSALDPALVSRLVRHSWPGNVRQLRNVARHLAINSQDVDGMTVDANLERLLARGAGAETPISGERLLDRIESRRRTSAQSVAGITEEELLQALRASGFRPGPAAVNLGIGRTTIYKLIDKCPAIRKASDITDDELLNVWNSCSGDVAEMALQLEVSQRALKLRLKRFTPPDGSDV